MKRQEMLKSTLTKESKEEVLITKTSKEDKKFITRSKRELEDAIEDLEKQMNDRLEQPVPLDKSVVEVLYFNISETKAKLALYESFEKSYL